MPRAAELRFRFVGVWGEVAALMFRPTTAQVDSRPWSQVFIDGRSVGNTPQLGLRLPAGRYTVRLANSELGMSKTLIVNVAAGEFVSRVETLEEP